MRPVFSLIATVILAACAMSSTPPGGTCATRASVELNALQSAITTAETNLARGYSVERRLIQASNEIEPVRVPINAAKERQILAELKAKLGPLQAQTEAMIAQCEGGVVAEAPV